MLIKNFVITILLTLIFTNCSAQQQKRDIGSNWHFVMSPVFGITNKETVAKTFGENSAKYYAWEELRKCQYRDSGAIYFEKHPNDVGFKEWFLKTVDEDAPHYWKNLELEAAKLAKAETTGSPFVRQYDEAAENNWTIQYLAFRNLYLSDTALTKKQKNGFRSQELQRNIQNLSEKIYGSSGNLEECFTSKLPLIYQYCQEASDIANGEIANPRPLQDALGALGAFNQSLEKGILSLLKESEDSTVRASAENYERNMARMRTEPSKLQLRSLFSGEKIDLEKMRGKVVLVDFWNIHCAGCIAAMPKYERLYKQFHKNGFEILSVCVTGVVYSDPNETEQTMALKLSKERMKALDLLKRKGVTYLTAELNPGKDAHGETNWNNPPEWKNFGNAYGGSVFLLDQQGRLVSTDIGGQWLEFNIRKLLKLPLDATGKE